MPDALGRPSIQAPISSQRQRTARWLTRSGSGKSPWRIARYSELVDSPVRRSTSGRDSSSGACGSGSVRFMGRSVPPAALHHTTPHDIWTRTGDVAAVSGCRGRVAAGCRGCRGGLSRRGTHACIQMLRHKGRGACGTRVVLFDGVRCGRDNRFDGLASAPVGHVSSPTADARGTCLLCPFEGALVLARPHRAGSADRRLIRLARHRFRCESAAVVGLRFARVWPREVASGLGGASMRWQRHDS